MRYLKSIWFAAAVLTVIGVGVVHAQVRDAAAKVRGEYGETYTPASRSLLHARDYADDFHSYVQQTQQNKELVDPEVAKEHAEELGRNIAMLQKHLVRMRKHAAGDKETLASLDVIDKHVKEAAKAQAALAAIVAKPPVDAEAAEKYSDEASKSLNLAIAEHDKLMKKLAMATRKAAPK
jgi:hypothetical protein